MCFLSFIICRSDQGNSPRYGNAYQPSQANSSQWSNRLPVNESRSQRLASKIHNAANHTPFTTQMAWGYCRPCYSNPYFQLSTNQTKLHAVAIFIRITLRFVTRVLSR